jgi:hypothetical protein
MTDGRLELMEEAFESLVTSTSASSKTSSVTSSKTKIEEEKKADKPGKANSWLSYWRHWLQHGKAPKQSSNVTGRQLLRAFFSEQSIYGESPRKDHARMYLSLLNKASLPHVKQFLPQADPSLT